MSHDRLDPLPHSVSDSSSDHCLRQLLAESLQAILNQVMVNIDRQPNKTQCYLGDRPLAMSVMDYLDWVSLRACL